MILHKNHGSILTSLSYVKYQRVSFNKFFIMFLHMLFECSFAFISFVTKFTSKLLVHFGSVCLNLYSCHKFLITDTAEKKVLRSLMYSSYMNNQMDLSEQAIEETNYGSKQNVLRHSYRGSYEQQNLGLLLEILVGFRPLYHVLVVIF